jgi:hypothetical protein
MKQSKHRRKRGMLTSLVKYPKDARHGKDSLWRKAGRWVGGTLLIAALVVMVAGLLVMMFRPDLALATKEGEFQVLEVNASTAGFRPEEQAVGAAVISVDGHSVRIPLRADNRAGVEKNRTLRVRYTLNPSVGVVRVERWSLVEQPPR